MNVGKLSVVWDVVGVVVVGVLMLVFLFCGLSDLKLEGIVMCSGALGVDSVGVVFGLMFALVGFMSVVGDESLVLGGETLNYVLVLAGVVLLCAVSVFVVNWILFYLFFEVSGVLGVVLVLMMGVNPERLSVGLRGCMYLVCGGFPTVFCVCWFVVDLGSGSVALLDLIKGGSVADGFWVLMMSGFLIKVPIYPVHKWLMDLYDEGSVSGSMVLGGVVSKMGVLGVYRSVSAFGVPSVGLYVVLVMVFLWGGLVCSVLCFSCYSVVSMVVYSSIVHMKVCVLGLLSGLNVGWSFSGMLCVGHGVCMCLLLMLSGYISGLVGCKSWVLNKGVVKMGGALWWVWFVSCCMNLSVPPSVGWLGECFSLCSVLGLLNKSGGLVVLMVSVLVLGVGYSVVLFSVVGLGFSSVLTRPISGDIGARCLVVSAFGIWLTLEGWVVLDSWLI